MDLMFDGEKGCPFPFTRPIVESVAAAPSFRDGHRLADSATAPSTLRRPVMNRID
jgi:hypothetical protein